MSENRNNTVGILTFHRTTNFGSLLQTFGLYEQVKKLGKEPVIVDYRCPAVEKREQVDRKKDFSSPKAIARELLFQPIIRKKSKALYAFVTENMNVSRSYEPEKISEADADFGRFLVGSDIVWGLDITENDTVFFLDFVKEKKKKFAFASSVGHREPTDQDRALAPLLSDFASIAVREEDGAAWVRELTGSEPPVVCDPTMLLTAEEWEKRVPPRAYRGNYVLVYFDSDNHKCSRDAVEYAKKHGFEVWEINYGRSHSGMKSVRPTDLSEFLGLIKNAATVFTASYHGFLFSVYFHKQFVFYTRAHKSRVLSLEKRLGLRRCGDAAIDFIDERIDYDAVDAEVDAFRRSSVEILKGMLNE